MAPEKPLTKRGERMKWVHDNIHEDAMIAQFAIAAERTISNPEAPPVTREWMADLMGLSGDQSDGKKFIERFAHGISDPELHSLLTDDDEKNDGKKYAFGLPLRHVNKMFSDLENGSASPSEIAFLDSLVHCSERQITREAPELFCEMGLDFMVRMIGIHPDAVSTDMRERMMAQPAPIPSMRPFTKFGNWEGDTAGEMMLADRARRAPGAH